VVPAGNVLEAKIASRPPRFIKPSVQTGNRKVGVKYEQKAQDYIQLQADKLDDQSPGVKVSHSPWLVFRSEGDQPDHVRYCQPDCLLIDEWQRKLTIIEIKLQHCVEAHDQVRKLYEPVLKLMYPDYLFAALELVQWHDPHINFPETYYFEPNIFEAQVNKFAIHIWNPRYDKLSVLPKSIQAAPSTLAKKTPPSYG